MGKLAFVKRMKWVLPLALLVCLPQSSRAADSALEPDCPAPGGVQRVVALADLPPAVTAAIGQHIPNLAPEGSPFNRGDALMPGQTHLDRRFLTAFHRDSRWTVAYEAAGIGTYDNVVAFQMSTDGQAVQVLANIQTWGPAVCTELARWLNPDFPVSRFW